MKWCVIGLLVACGDNRLIERQQSPDSNAPVDTHVDTPPDVGPPVRVFGNIDFGGGLEGVTVALLGTAEITTTDSQGDFFFDVPQGSRMIVKATATSRPELMPMIRGVVAQENLRPRVFYMLGPPDVANATALGKTFDPSKAIIEVDFRNAEIGGYGATLTGTGGTLQPGFGVALEDDGDPVLAETTVAGGGGSTLLLADLPAGDATLAAVVPAAVTLPCQQRDANPIPLQAGVVTWVDYECGNATD